MAVVINRRSTALGWWSARSFRHLVDFEVQRIDQHVIFDDSNRQVHIALDQRLQDVLQLRFN